MSVLDIVLKRRSIRKFQKKDIPDELIDKLIDALIWAPSAGNLQARKFYFIRDDNIKNELVHAALAQRFISEAPLVVVACADRRIFHHYGERGESLYCLQDVACSLMCLMLVACELGLGTVWVGAFYEDRVSKILDLPSYLRPVAIVPVGWPAKIPSAPPRVKRQEAVVWV